MYMVWWGCVKIFLMFLVFLKEGMIDFLGKILVKEGELLMRCWWEYRIFLMFGKEGL